ncbi:transcription elongation regulator 1 [Brevipalpus obovatus]|uniref:transcription elongation regulator 1 n=1 Tax=Brevipalpus obovatus TaxID=246614 RepID=UPI003D9F6E1D
MDTLQFDYPTHVLTSSATIDQSQSNQMVQQQQTQLNTQIPNQGQNMNQLIQQQQQPLQDGQQPVSAPIVPIQPQNMNTVQDSDGDSQGGNRQDDGNIQRSGGNGNSNTNLATITGTSVGTPVAPVVSGGNAVGLCPPVALPNIVFACPPPNATNDGRNLMLRANPYPLTMPRGFHPYDVAHPFSVPPNLALNPTLGQPALWPNNMMGAMPHMDPTRQALLSLVDPEVKQAAAEWTEYKAPDGKPYYFSQKTKQSVWDKPKALINLEEALVKAKSKQGESIPKATDTNKSSEVRVETLNDVAHPFGVPPNLALNPAVAQHSLWPNNIMGAMPHMDPARQALLMFVDPEVKQAAAEWTEYKAPDGKPYYFSQKTKQSVWDKPKALINLEEALVKAKSKQGEAISKAVDTNKSSEVRVETLDDESQPEIVSEKVPEKKPEQPRDKSRPVSSTPVSGTPWCVVWTGDNKVFFYNPSTKTSVWDKPHELKSRADVDKLLEGPPKSEDEPSSSPQEKRPAEVEPEKITKKPKKSEEESEKENKKDPITNLQIIAAKQRETIPLEERIQMFRNMLVEKEVSAFSSWERELQKIVFDPRYLLLTSKERKQVFDKYVKEKAEEERREKRQKLKQQKEDFRGLLEEADLNYRITYSEFAQKYSKDERFRNIEKSKDRENIFNDYISDLRRKEKEEKAAQREKAKQGFLGLLKEQTYLDRHSRWSETKEKIRDDPRYKALDSSSTREDTFKSYISSLPSRKVDSTNDALNEGNSEDDDEIPAREREKIKEKQERIEASLREREKEVARELSSHFRERDKEREQHKHAEAVEHFNALLTDLVRNPDFSWKEAKKVLKKDHRWEFISSLDRDEREKLFNVHIDALHKKKKEKFRELLEETREITLTSSWREIRRLIKDDPRYTKFSSRDRKCEREFREYLKDKLAQAKNHFKELLKETKIITYKSKKSIEDSEQHLQDIIAVLQSDKRYLVLDCIEDERRHLLMSYIEELDRKGPPPPPTASEPARRPTNKP